MNIFKEVINLCKDYFQKEKMMAKAYEEITEKMENGISLADQIVDVLKENKKLKARIEQAKKIIRTFLNMPMPNNEEVFADVGVFLTEAEQFLKDL